MSEERLDYDDDPAGTAADNWLATPLGMATLWEGPGELEASLRRAFRAAWLIRDHEWREGRINEM